jgi:hypothetical protein
MTAKSSFELLIGSGVLQHLTLTAWPLAGRSTGW